MADVLLQQEAEPRNINPAPNLLRRNRLPLQLPPRRPLLSLHRSDRVRLVQLRSELLRSPRRAERTLSPLPSFPPLLLSRKENAWF